MSRGATDLSVIVVNWNGGDLLTSCLQSLEAATAGLEAETWLVDNASTDGSPERAASACPRVLMIRNSTNVGFARAVNAALPRATGECVLLLNPDAGLSAAVLRRLLEVLGSDARIGLVGCPSIDSSGRAVPGYESSFPGARRQPVVAGGETIRDVAWISGACLLARREMIAEVGPLDPSFFMYYEDVDWCYRARAQGWRVVSVGEIAVRHELGGSSGEVDPAARAARIASSRLRFYWKHYPAGRARLLALRLIASSLLGGARELLLSPFSGRARRALQVDSAQLRVALAGLSARKTEDR